LNPKYVRMIPRQRRAHPIKKFVAHIRPRRKCAPSPALAGEGWGGDVSAKRTDRVERLSPTRRALASASTSPAGGRGGPSPRPTIENHSGPRRRCTPSPALAGEGGVGVFPQNALIVWRDFPPPAALWRARRPPPQAGEVDRARGAIDAINRRSFRLRLYARFSTFAILAGTPNSRRQISASTAMPSRICSVDGLAKQSRRRLLE
jgi:hypothetical protein